MKMQFSEIIGKSILNGSPKENKIKKSVPPF
jgi:hypothetical protein